MGTQTLNLSQTSHNSSIGDHDRDRRRFRFINVGYAAAPVSTWGMQF
jgi:hypothetical protein